MNDETSIADVSPPSTEVGLDYIESSKPVDEQLRTKNNEFNDNGTSQYSSYFNNINNRRVTSFSDTGIESASSRSDLRGGVHTSPENISVLIRRTISDSSTFTKRRSLSFSGSPQSRMQRKMSGVSVLRQQSGLDYLHDENCESRNLVSEIRNVPTFGSSDGSESEILHDQQHQVDNNNDTNLQKAIIKQNDDIESHEINLFPTCLTQADSHDSKDAKMNLTSNSSSEKKESWDECVEDAIFIASFGILGTVLRFYVERFFGMDCEMRLSGHPINDFFQEITSHICVTTSGTTNQTGGALFLDLPANMLGSFIMGLVSPAISGHSIPWFQSNHPLQQHRYFHEGLRVGLCGCLTTLSSWNTQMVVMMDGTGTELGSQVFSALFGYVLGISCSLSSFNFGRIVAEWMKRIHVVASREGSTGSSNERGISSRDDSNGCRRDVKKPKNKLSSLVATIFGVRHGSQIATLALLAAFIVGDFVEGISFYRKVWLSILFSPFGSILRWRLSKLNAKGLPKYNLNWFPVGTFVCNITAVIVSIAVQAYVVNLTTRSVQDDWLLPVLQAITGGFTGSLSTVSTLAKEMAGMSSPAHSTVYCVATIMCSMVLGLILYRPIALAG